MMKKVLVFFLALLLLAGAAACGGSGGRAGEPVAPIIQPLPSPAPTPTHDPNVPLPVSDEQLFGTVGEIAWRVDRDTETLTISGTGAIPDFIDEYAPWLWLGLRSPISYGDEPSLYNRLVIEEGITEIGARAFRGLYLTSLSLPDSLQTIGELAFQNIDVSFLEIPKNVTVIEETAFFWNWQDAFYVDENNPNFCAIDGVLFDKDVSTLIAYPTQRDGNIYEIPATVKHIAAYAFIAWDICTPLSGIVLPEGLVSMGDGAFARGYAFFKTTLPKSLRTIGAYAFEDLWMHDLILPEGIEELPDRVFAYADLKRIVLPGSLKMMHNEAFYGCYKLEQVYFLGNPPALAENAPLLCNEKVILYYPSSLSSVWAPNGETEWNGCKIEPYDVLPEIPEIWERFGDREEYW
ncbi:MAG: leucine-rich repeat domain-containing protein [Clostridiales bacterium]|nr:leucine-rich repeat domain-containing protein [Clostridiales bacterium]